VTIAFVALTKGYLTIGRGLILTQNKTIAVNIAHEKIETLKKLTYPRLYVTTTTAYDYDMLHYPPVTYTVKRDGNIEELSASDPDEGLKRIKVRVEWTENERTKNVTIYNLRQNPDRTPLSGTITGKVRKKSDGNPITGATVYVLENPNWSASTDTNGDFEIKLSTGSWKLKAFCTEYFPKVSTFSYTVTPGGTTNAGNIDLPEMGTGNVWGLVKSTHNVPIEGAIITCNDEISEPFISKATSYYGHPGTTNFLLSDNVSTGTWTVFATSGSLSGNTTGVTVLDDGYTQCDIVLDAEATTGSISGKVYKDDTGDHGDTKVSTGEGISVKTNTTGYYKIENVGTGATTVTANPGPHSPEYTTETTTVTVNKGENVKAKDMTIYPAGNISGTVKTFGGTDAYPRMVIRAIDKNNIERGVGISDLNGYYEISQLPTKMGLSFLNPYRIMPVLDDEETSDPVSGSTVVVKNKTATGNDFIITQAWGYISGNVTVSSEPITTGVLIIASTGTISDSASPPDMNVGATGIYGGITRTEGEYEIKVRVGYTYNVYAWYTEINDSWDGTKTTPQSALGKSLSGTPPSASVDFEW